MQYRIISVASTVTLNVRFKDVKIRAQCDIVNARGIISFVHTRELGSHRLGNVTVGSFLHVATMITFILHVPQESSFFDHCDDLRFLGGRGA